MARNRDDLDRFMDYDIYVPTRTIHIGGKGRDLNGDDHGVDQDMLERAVKNLHFLDQTPDKPINIILNTIGGCTSSGMAIYDAVAACRNHVTITVSASAMSMGSIILQAADHRVLHEHSRVMIHDGEVHVGGNKRLVKNWLKDSDNYDVSMQQILLNRIRERHPHYKLKTLQELLPFDKILLSHEAVELGLADEVIKNGI